MQNSLATIALLLSGVLCGSASGQNNVSTSADVVSHRMIPPPGAKQPSPLDWLRRFRKAMERAKQGPLPPAVPEMDKLPQETREWVEQLQGQQMREMADDFAKAAGAQPMELPRLEVPGDLLGDLPLPNFPKNNISPSQLRRLLKDYFRDQAEKTAAGADDDQTSEKTEGGEELSAQAWLETIKPFLNDELADTLAKATDLDTLGTAPTYRPATKTSRLRPGRNRSANAARSPTTAAGEGAQRHALGKSWLDKVVENADRSSTAWLKQVAGSGDTQKPGWWKTMKARASRELRTWNRQFARQSRTVSRRLDSVEPPAQLPTVPQLALPSLSQIGSAEGQVQPAIWIALFTSGALILVFAAITVAKARYADRRNVSSPRGDDLAVVDRKSLVGVCHGLLVSHFGTRYQPWNHHQSFEALARKVTGKHQELAQLSKLYEAARYAPQQQLLTKLQVEQARCLLASVRSGSTAVS